MLLTCLGIYTQGKDILFHHGTWQAIVEINLKESLLQGCAYLTANDGHEHVRQQVTCLRSLFPDILSQTSSDEGSKLIDRGVPVEYTVHAGPPGCRHDRIGKRIGKVGTQDGLATIVELCI